LNAYDSNWPMRRKKKRKRSRRRKGDPREELAAIGTPSGKGGKKGVRTVN